DACQVTDLAKRPVTIVVKKKVGHRVVGDENVLPAVIVVVEGHHAQPVAGLQAHSRGLADVRERAIAVVVIEGGGLPLVNVRMAVAAIAGLAFSAPEVVVRRPVHVIGDYEIESSIVVIIEPSRARAPLTSVGNAGPRRDVGEGPVAVVVIEDASIVA